MARRESKNNLALLRDNLSESNLGLFYRLPSTKERQSYINKRQVRQGNKFVDNTVANRIFFAKRIITGLRDKDFERLVDGKYQWFSSTPGSENFYPEWLEWMEEHCADVLGALAIRVFEIPVTPGITDQTEVDEDLDPDVGDGAEDLEKE